MLNYQRVSPAIVRWFATEKWPGQRDFPMLLPISPIDWWHLSRVCCSARAWISAITSQWLQQPRSKWRLVGVVQWLVDDQRLFQWEIQLKNRCREDFCSDFSWVPAATPRRTRRKSEILGVSHPKTGGIREWAGWSHDLGGVLCHGAGRWGQHQPLGSFTRQGDTNRGFLDF